MDLKKFFSPVKIKHENLMEHIVRRISGPMARVLASIGVTPNQVTLSRIPVMLYAFYLFSTGQPKNLYAACICIILFEILDHVDGDIATLKDQLSAKGEWLENVIDNILGTVGGFLGLAITIGIYRQSGGYTPWLVFSLTACGWCLFKRFITFDVIDNTSTSVRDSFLNLREKSFWAGLAHYFYYWVELFIIPAVILYEPFMRWFHVNTLLLLMICYCLMYNAFWIVILIKQYSILDEGSSSDTQRGGEV